MNNTHNQNRANIALLLGFSAGFLSGGVLGAGVMLLMAPRAGKQTRSKIEKQGKKLRKQATESLEDAVHSAGDKAHQFTNSVQKEVDGVQEYAQDLIGKGRN